VSFAGFPERSLDFYEGLEADNTKAYWTDHREVYEHDVRAPMQELLAALEPEFGPAKLFRPYRDVRFSKDKTPYKTTAAAAIGDDVQGGLYVQLSAGGLMLAGGAHSMTTDQARRLRAALADDRPGRAIAAVLDALRSEGFTIEGERLKRLPKEFAPEHPRAELLTRKALFAVRRYEPTAWLHTPQAATEVAQAWRAVAPLNAWLRDHVGPPRVERQRPGA